jgi:competence ComEA-like helix-hairpin-helix protein
MYAYCRKAFKTGSGYLVNTPHDPGNLRKADSLFRLRAMKTNAGAGFTHITKKFAITDINQADSAEWSALPGIGEKLASRIIHFREKLGGFYQIEQVGETFGLPDSSFQKIKPFLRMGTDSLRLINLNRASREELQSHPYIRWQIARQIMDYRRQHEIFKSVEELLQLVQMDDLKFKKLKPYLVTQP